MPKKMSQDEALEKRKRIGIIVFVVLVAIVGLLRYINRSILGKNDVVIASLDSGLPKSHDDPEWLRLDAPTSVTLKAAAGLVEAKHPEQASSLLLGEIKAKPNDAKLVFNAARFFIGIGDEKSLDVAVAYFSKIDREEIEPYLILEKTARQYRRSALVPKFRQMAVAAAKKGASPKEREVLHRWYPDFRIPESTK